MFSSTLVSLFVCLLAALRKNYSTDFHNIRRNVARGLWKKQLGFGGNPLRYVRVRVRAELRLLLGGDDAIFRIKEYKKLS